MRYTPPTYTLYDHVNKTWVQVTGRVTEFDLATAKRYIPQHALDQDKFDKLVAGGENIGVAMLLVLGNSIP